jgi:hypothetical protein
MQLANEESKTPEITSDPHELMLARLRFELKERQRYVPTDRLLHRSALTSQLLPSCRLEEKKLALQAQQKEALRVNKQKKAELMRLEQDLKSVIAVSLEFF